MREHRVAAITIFPHVCSRRSALITILLLLLAVAESADSFALHRPAKSNPLPVRPTAPASFKQQHVNPHANGRKPSRQSLSTRLKASVEDFSQAYHYCLEHHFYVTQALTGALFSGCGDILAQTFIEKDPLTGKYNPIRTSHYVLKGLGGGIMWALWFQMADVWTTSMTEALLKSQYEDASNLSHETSFRVVRTIMSIAMEQFLVCPLFYTFWDIPLPALLRGTPPASIPRQVQQTLLPLLWANAQLWTPVNVITYNLPVEYRVVFSNATDLIWQSILAAMTSKDKVAVQEMVPVVEQQQQQQMAGSNRPLRSSTAVASERVK